MRRKILIPINDANELEVNRINEEIRRMEEEAEALREQREAAARLQEARSRRDLEQRRLQRIVGNNNVQISTAERWEISGLEPPVMTMPRTADEIISEAFGEPKQEEPNVELQKVDTAKFVFHWENSSSVEEFVEAAEADEDSTDYYRGGFEYYQSLARMIRSVEKIPLRELPDERPTVKRGSRIQNFS